ncbi:MAG TPA: hypothetical protein VFW98_14645 [Gemmatimonadaceae bacterium]|nr:hypothetical protein [Gemmatimonadaceae bacterium]
MPSRFRHGIRRHRAAQFIASLLAACTLVAACAREPASAAAPQAAQINEHLFILPSSQGNMVVLLGKDSSLVVGPPAPSLVQNARALVTSQHAGPVRFAVITSSDSALDYEDGGWGRTGAVVLAHELLRARMQRLRRTRSDAYALPNIGFSEVVQLYVGGNAVHAIHHRAGYTDSDLIVHFEKDNVVYLGNTFTANGYPTIDLTRGGALAGMIQTVQGFERFPASTRFVPGRGPLASMSVLQSYATMLTTVRDTVQRLIDAGKTQAQVIAAKPTAGLDAQWGKGPISPDAFVGMVYQSLSQH